VETRLAMGMLALDKTRTSLPPLKVAESQQRGWMSLKANQSSILGMLHSRTSRNPLHVERQPGQRVPYRNIDAVLDGKPAPSLVPKEPIVA
jgi:hypothetical protein